MTAITTEMRVEAIATGIRLGMASLICGAGNKDGMWADLARDAIAADPLPAAWPCWKLRCGKVAGL